MPHSIRELHSRVAALHPQLNRTWKRKSPPHCVSQRKSVRTVSEVPIPCWRPGPRRPNQAEFRPGKRYALFIFRRASSEVCGAVVAGRQLPVVEAQQLWSAHQWQPSAEGQELVAGRPLQSRR